MKKEVSEIIVSFLVLLLVFSAPVSFSLYNMGVLTIGLLISFVGRIFFQKKIQKTKTEFRTDKKLCLASIFVSFFSLGIFSMSSVGALSRKSKKTASWGIGYNLALAIGFFLASAFLESISLSVPYAFTFSILLLQLSNLNISLSISNIIPYKVLDGKVIYEKDKKTFWALSLLSICMIFLIILWYRFSIFYQITI